MTPWLSALIRTAKATKCIPEHVTAIDWVPVDIAANMMRDFITRPVQQEAQVYHICHPNPQRWGLLVDILRELLAVADTTPLREWTRKLRQITDPSPEDIAQMPALTIFGLPRGTWGWDGICKIRHSPSYKVFSGQYTHPR
ncbi:hypothetical protein Daesc_005287 [Daldinia eschscholtzii]|uniref:Uncharacterized protein n=1 Tax=Daldinia eschscholtzii TaxID=292717 RepID=A0AAX6MJZ7_9PEZI